MLDKLKQEVYEANFELHEKGLSIYTWGNVSGIDRKRGLVVIKPSGIAYSQLCPESMAVVELESGRQIEGSFKPSSDTPTHLTLYRAFSELGGVVHTHSMYATIFAQAGKEIPALGTTHADYFYREILCTRSLTEKETAVNYECNTGNVIVETLHRARVQPEQTPAVLVRHHGPFAWGSSAAQAVYHAVVLEQIAQMAWNTLCLNPQSAMPDYLLQKHYTRKHGANAYYGQGI